MDAEKTFYEADLVMQKAFKDKNPQYAIQSIEEMMKTVMMMCQETENGPDGKPHKLCPVLQNLDKTKFKAFSYVTKDLFDPTKTLKM